MKRNNSLAKSVRKELIALTKGKKSGGFNAMNREVAQIAKNYLLRKGYEVELSEAGNEIHVEFYSKRNRTLRRIK